MYATNIELRIPVGAQQLGNGAVTGDNLTMDSTAKRRGYVFTTPKDSFAVDQIAFATTGLTGSPSLDMSIQGVDASGDPDGTTLAQASSVTPSNGINYVTLSSTVTLAYDTVYSVVAEASSAGAVSSTDSLDILAFKNAAGVDFPYTVTETSTTGGWSRTRTPYSCFALRNSNDTDDVIGVPTTKADRLTTVITSTGHRMAQTFMLPLEMGRRVQIGGVQVSAFLQSNVKIGIWSTDAVIELSPEVDKDVSDNAGQHNTYAHYFTPVWLDTGVKYYVGIEQQSTDAANALINVDAEADANLSAFINYPNNNAATYNGTTWSSVTGEICRQAELFATGFDRGMPLIGSGGMIE